MLDGLTLDQMRVFATVAETGSFRAASNKLARAQSAISYSIASLEEQLGLKLFKREGVYRPILTDNGRILLAEALTILRRVDVFKARAHGLEQAAEIELKIALDQMFPASRIAVALDKLQRTFPFIAIRIITGTLGASLQSLLNREVTMAITFSSEAHHPSIQREALGSIPMYAVTSPNHPLAALPSPISDADFAEHFQVVVSDPKQIMIGKDYGVISPRTWRVGDYVTKRELLIAGCGWGSLPKYMIEDDLRQSRLTRISPLAMGSGDGTTNVDSFLAWLTTDPPGPVASLFREELLKLTY